MPLNGQKERDEKMEHRNHHHGPTTRRQALGEINGNTARENTNAGKNALAAKRGYVFVLALKYYTRDDVMMI